MCPMHGGGGVISGFRGGTLFLIVILIVLFLFLILIAYCVHEVSQSSLSVFLLENPRQPDRNWVPDGRVVFPFFYCQRCFFLNFVDSLPFCGQRHILSGNQRSSQKTPVMFVEKVFKYYWNNNNNNNFDFRDLSFAYFQKGSLICRPLPLFRHSQSAFYGNWVCPLRRSQASSAQRPPTHDRTRSTGT